MVTYSDVYEFVATGKKQKTEVLNYLIDVKKTPASSANRHIKNIKDGDKGLFKVTQKTISIDKMMMKELLLDMFMKYGVAYENLEEAIRQQKEDEIKQITNQSAELQKKVDSLENDLKQTNEELSRWKKKYELLFYSFIENRLDKPVVIASDLKIIPEPVNEQGIFMDDTYEKIDTEKSISKYGGKREAFYDTQPVEDKESDKILTEKNYKNWIARKIMIAPFFKSWYKDLIEEKENKVEEQGSIKNIASDEQSKIKETKRRNIIEKISDNCTL